MFDPWFGPLLMSSASTIALRTWFMLPAGAAAGAWQQREATRMVGEKLAAVREAQLAAISAAWRMWLSPWAMMRAPAGRGVARALESARADVVAPFSRRAAANARRLRTRAANPTHAFGPVLAAVAATTPRSGSKRASLRPPKARTGR